MKKNFRSLYIWIVELVTPSVLIGLLLLAATFLFPYLKTRLQIMRLDVWDGHQWEKAAYGWDILWYAMPLMFLIVAISVLLGVSIGIIIYEASAGSDYRKRLEQAKQRFLRAEKIGLERAKQQLQDDFSSISAREKECNRQVLNAMRQAEADEQRVRTAEWMLARTKETLVKLEGRKSNAQGAAERHKRRNRQDPKVDDYGDYSSDPSPKR